MRKILVIFFMSAALLAQAQKVIDDFTLTNVVDGKPVSLSAYPSCSGVIIIFTSNTCPYDEYYRSRIQKLSQAYHDKVPLFLVNALVDATESADQMSKKTQQAGIRVPYLADKDQVLMQKLGATKTPQAFLLKNTGGQFTVVYSGALDDNAQVESDVHHAYLRDAVDIMLANQQIATREVRPVGCTIRKK